MSDLKQLQQAELPLECCEDLICSYEKSSSEVIDYQRRLLLFLPDSTSKVFFVPILNTLCRVSAEDQIFLANVRFYASWNIC